LLGSFLPEPLGIYRCGTGLANKPFPTLFPENYSFAERKNFTRNALQSDGIRRDCPPLRLIKPTGEGRKSQSREEEDRKGRRLGRYKWRRNDIREWNREHEQDECDV